WNKSAITHVSLEGAQQIGTGSQQGIQHRQNADCNCAIKNRYAIDNTLGKRSHILINRDPIIRSKSEICRQRYFELEFFLNLYRVTAQFKEGIFLGMKN